MKTWLCIGVLILSIATAGTALGQQVVSQLQTAQGLVSEVDSVGSILVILIGSDQVRFSVDSGARIEQGSDNIFLEDIEQGDPVSVRYYEAPDGTRRITSIIDSNLGGDF